MISVVMATYNSATYLLKQLDSIINQTEQVDEVIIIDDCSSDNTIDLIDNYIFTNKLENWKLYKHEANLGYIHTFRDGLAYCKGDIIITCDHDDIWMSDKVEIIKKTLNSSPEILYLATSFVQIDENGSEIFIKQKNNRANNNLIRRSIQKGCLNKMKMEDVAIYNIAPGCMCAMRDTVKSRFLAISDITVLPHDWSMAIIAALNDGLYYLDKPTTLYRIYSKNTIGLGHEGRYQARLHVVEKNLIEKKDSLRILEECHAKTQDLEYFLNVKNIFEKRCKYLKNKNVLKLLVLAIYSFKYGTIYESIIYDALSIVLEEKTS